MTSNNTITIQNKTFELNENDIFQDHISISVDEFFELLEQKLLLKFELSNKTLIYHQMASFNHIDIDVNLIRDISVAFLGQKRYKVLGENALIACPDYNSYYMPDASVVIAKEIEVREVGEKKKVQAVTNAIGVFEILSDSTENYDRTTKYENYKKIPSLKQYTLISQHKIQVENFVKNSSGEWKCTIYTSKNDYFSVIEDQFKLKIGNLYLQTSLDEE